MGVRFDQRSGEENAQAIRGAGDMFSRCEGPGTCLRDRDVTGRSGVRGSSWSTSGAACGTL